MAETAKNFTTENSHSSYYTNQRLKYYASGARV
jgi:hypothetical protein